MLKLLFEQGTLAQDLVWLTDENWAEEESDGDVDDRGGHVQKPVGAHGEESQEEQKEEQGVLVLLHLTAAGDILREKNKDKSNAFQLKNHCVVQNAL